MSKKTTGELKEGIGSLASMLNKNGKGTLYFGVRNVRLEAVQNVSVPKKVNTEKKQESGNAGRDRNPETAKRRQRGRP